MSFTQSETNLKTLSDATLVERTLSLAREERELLTKVLHHLREIAQRRLFSALGYKSLFEFTVRHLGYSEDQAYRRIAAMKVLKELPQIEEKINAGEISLTHIGLAQNLFQQEKKRQSEMSLSEKLSVFEKISSQPVREAEKMILSLSSAPETLKPDRVRVMSEDQIEMKLQASAGLLEKIEKLKGLLAHQSPNLSLGELFEKLCDLGLSEWNPGKFAAPRKRRVNTLHRKASGNLPLSQAETRRQVFQRANNRCENCGSGFALEVDHRKPHALGGTSDLDNLRVLCRSCNQRAAIEAFGMNKMMKHLSS